MKRNRQSWADSEQNIRECVSLPGGYQVKYKLVLLIILVGGVLLISGQVRTAVESGTLKIGYIVKRPSEKWFEYELIGAEKAAGKYGAELLVVGGQDPEQTLNAVSNLIARGVSGVVICSSEVKLGTAIRKLTDLHNVKLFSVDDRFEYADGGYIEEIPHLGISVEQVSALVADYLDKEMERRGWKYDETALCALSYEPLKTSSQRAALTVKGVTDAGFPPPNIHMISQAGIDQRHAYEAADVLFGQFPNVKNWLVCGFNDQSAIGAARALGAHGFSAEHCIVVGINGLDAARVFAKDEDGILSASVLLNPYRHGYASVEMMCDWLNTGEKPPLLTLTAGAIIDRLNYREKLDMLYRQQENAIGAESGL